MKGKLVKCLVHTFSIHNTQIRTNRSTAFQINHQQQASGSDKYENAYAQAVAIKFSRSQEHEPSTLRTGRRFIFIKIVVSRQRQISSLYFRTCLHIICLVGIRNHDIMVPQGYGGINLALWVSLLPYQMASYFCKKLVRKFHL